MKRSTGIEIICTFLIVLFLYTASSKLLHLQTTYREINSQPFPNWLTPYIVWGTSLIELLVVGLLMFDRTKKAGLWSSLILMTLFTAYVGAILLHIFSRVPCSCGGVIKQLGWTNHLYFNLFFLLMSFVGLALLRKIRSIKYNPVQKQVVFT